MDIRESFSLSIGARKSFSRLYLSHCPILGQFLSQFEAPIQRKGNCGARGAEGYRGRGGKGRGREEEGVAKHSARVVPESARNSARMNPS